MGTKHYSDKGRGAEPAYTAVGTYGEGAQPYITTVYTWNGPEAAMKLAHEACAADNDASVDEGPGLRLVALFQGDPELVDFDREQYKREPITVLAQRLLHDSSGAYIVTQEDTGGGVVVCQVTHYEDDDAAYAWITDSQRAAAPFLVGVYLPDREEHVSLEAVGVHELVDAVFRALARAEEQSKRASS